LAVRRGDEDTLSRLGLNLGELRALSPFQQVQQILNVLVGSGGAIEESELREANAPALRQIIIDDLSGTDAVRVFVIEYVMQVYASECGEASRDGSRPGGDSLEGERQLRSAVETRVALLETPEDAVSSDQLSTVINEALKTMRRLRPK